MQDMIQEVYTPLLTDEGFTPIPDCPKYGPAGMCWQLSDKTGQGCYWTYGQKNLFNIRIHDFYFHGDTLMDFNLPECLSVTYYESISGEELSPYRRMCAGMVKVFHGGSPYRVSIHKKIPLVCIGIEITPEYYNEYLKKQYPEEYINPKQAFLEMDQTMDFPEMVRLLLQVKHYRGTGMAAKLFYEGKVAEAVSLIVDRSKAISSKKSRGPSSQDTLHLENVTAYLNDHFALDVPQERLAKIACMGTTKLKYVFKQYHGCTITEYIQRKRMSQAEHLLANSDLSVGQIAKAVGYESASRFAELFRKNTGLQPRVYRDICGK